jgi:sugar phosphate isomerase/epimerase
MGQEARGAPGQILTRRAFLRGGAAAAAALAARTPARAEPPGSPRLALSYGGFAMGIQSYTLRRLELAAALDAVRALGLARVELFTRERVGLFRSISHFPVTEDPAEIARVQALLAERGIALAAHGVNPIGDADEGRRLFAFAAAARIPILSCDPSQAVLPELDALLAAHPGIRLAIHNHGPHTRYSTIADVERALAGRHPQLGACVDTGHFIRSGEDPVEAIRRLGPRVYGVHLKDFAAEGTFARGVILGRGKLDLASVFRALRAVGFSAERALSLEYEEDPDDPLPGVESCLRAASEAAEQVARA